MNSLCYELLNGTLSSPNAGTIVNAQFMNQLPIPVQLDWVPMTTVVPTLVNSSGIENLPAIVQPNATFGDQGNFPVSDQWYFEATVPGTGGLISVFQFSAPGNLINLNPNLGYLGSHVATLSSPNDIGPIPVPTSSVPAGTIHPQPSTPVPNSTMIVPPDSPRVLVGCGTTPNGNYITREQYWERQSDSVCLAGNESRTVSFTVTEGKQETSSQEETVSKSLSAGVSGGWGPVSASISASLSKNSTSFQQVTVTEQLTTYVSHTMHNPHEQPVMYLRWQLIDVVTIFDKTSLDPVASIVMAENPIVVAGPYWTTQPVHPPNEWPFNKLPQFEYK
jgi:hypothetical protein